MITQPPGYLWKVIWLHAEGNESHHKELSPANHLSYPPAPPTLTPRVEKTCLQYLKGFSGDRQHGFYVFPKASSELRGTGVTGVNVPSHTSYRQPHRHPKHFWLQSHAQIQLTICADTTESPVENFPPSERFHNYLFTEAYCFSKTPLHTDTLQVICQILNLLVLRWKKKTSQVKCGKTHVCCKPVMAYSLSDMPSAHYLFFLMHSILFHSAGVLKDYLRELPYPLITKHLYEAVLESMAARPLRIGAGGCENDQADSEHTVSLLDSLPEVERVRKMDIPLLPFTATILKKIVTEMFMKHMIWFNIWFDFQGTTRHKFLL